MSAPKHVFGYTLLATLTCIAFGLGMWGLVLYLDAEGNTYVPLDIVYFAVQMVPMGFDYGSCAPLPWQLHVARFLIPIVAASGTVLMFSEVVRRRYALFLIKNHVVVCGFDRIEAHMMAEQAAQQGQQVVIIANTISQEGTAHCHSDGYLLMVGDIEHMARKARLEHAACIHIAHATDSESMGTLFAVQAYLKRHENAVNTFVYLQKIPAQMSDSFTWLKDNVFVQNSYMALAYATLCKYPLECDLVTKQHAYAITNAGTHASVMNYITALESTQLYTTPVIASSEKQIHIIFSCYNEVAEHLALATTNLAHFANGKLPHIHFLGCSTTQKEQFLARYPQIADTTSRIHAAELKFYEHPYEDNNTATLLRALDTDANALTTLVLCDNDSDIILKHIIRPLVQTHNITKLAWLDITRQDANFIRNLQDKLNTFVFYLTPAALKLQWDSRILECAKKLHTHYGGIPAWNDLEYFKKMSNIYCVLHYFIKCRALGITPDTPVQTLDNKQRETLNRMEHQRWVAERCIQGWTYGPQKNEAQREHPDMCPYDDLEEKTQNKDDTFTEINKYWREATHN